MKILILLACLMFCDSEHNQNLGDDLPVINLVESNHVNSSTKEFFESVEYIKLETTPGCWLGDDLDVFVTDKFIVTASYKQNVAYLFDRKSGKFIKQIGQKGKGPNDYDYISGGRLFDEQEMILYCDKGSTEKIGYNIENGEIKIIKLPLLRNVSAFTISPVNYFIKMGAENEYAGYVNNISGSDSIRLVIFDDNGNVVKSFPNYQHYTQINPSLYPANGGEFYVFNHSLFFKEPIFNDTIYVLNHKEMLPYATFYLGEHTPPYQLMIPMPNENRQNYFKVELLGENNKYIFFNYLYQGTRYCGYYYKQIKQTFVNKGYLDNNLGYYFIPKYMTFKGELTGILSAHEVVEYMKNKKNASNTVKHLSSIKEGDNPVIVIATLKK